MIWNEFNDNRMLEKIHQTLWRLFFLGNSLNIPYFEGGYLNKYLHNNIIQDLVKSKLIFFHFQMKDS